MDWVLVTTFTVQVTVLFFISRVTINLLYKSLHTILKHNSVVFSIISILFFPGTVLHELSHFIMAVVLMLKVRAIHMLPEWEHNTIKLGKVIYEKKDVVRSILVGIAPIIVGLLFFWWLSYINAIEIKGVLLKIVVFYLIFAVSSTMFSSKQDLIDIIYIIPIIIIVSILIYFFPVTISVIREQQFILETLFKFLYDVNIYLFISIVIHSSIIALLYIYNKAIHI